MRLIGPYPERKDLYHDRSPLNFPERISCPVLILQGADDRIVPAVQAEQIVDALWEHHLPHAYLLFPGEDHGFRGAENIIRSFEAELSFYGQVFGFTPADAIEPIEVAFLRRRRGSGRGSDDRAVTAAGLLGLAWAGAGPGHAVSLAEAKASDSIELLLALLLAATGLAIVARKIGIPYPILLVLGGLLIGFIPGLPSVELAPDVVFLLFLPPILFAAGYFTSIRDLRKNLRAILLLAVGLVLFTTFLVGAVAKLLVPDMAWAAALTLGAIVVAAGRGRVDRRVPAARRAAADRHDPRGREPPERRDGAGRLPIRRRRRRPSAGSRSSTPARPS